MIRSEEKPHKGKTSCSCCVPCLCACCALQTIICVVLVITLVLLGNALISRHYNSRNSPHELKDDRAFKYLRLKNDTRPIHYDLTLVPDLRTGSFYGVVNVTLKTDSLRKTIVLHSQNLTVLSASMIDGVSKSVIRVVNVRNLPDEEVVLLNLTRKITPGIYYLSMNYTGNMLNKLSGLYLSSYKNGKNQTR
ncbi:hypothetical protein WA026_009221 [Henosepilachna vigintioctopunctata]|uniref:Aminopeptidase N-like N-terminal domain-containing protein n=1 Tax=Henosepilachna vigintioctopunctata TaxID=420089 RepID=A0AAW1UWW9_9CUCU